MAVAAVLASRVPGPSLLWDGQGYLGAARWIARDDWPLLGELDFYHPAYGGLLAPAVWLGASPMGLFRWAQVVNVIAIAVCAVAVGGLARTLLPDGRRWLAATAAASAYPALVVQAGFEWPEAVFAAGFAVAALLAWRERWLGVAVASIALYALHPRGLGIVLATAGVLLVLRRWPAIVVLLAGVAGVQAVNRLALDALYNPRGGSAAGSVADKITDPGTWGDIVLKAAGHGWYLVAGTLGLAAVAMWALLAARRAPATWVAAAALGVLAASALQLAGRGRADHAVYGRYVEAVAPVLLVVAARHLRPMAVALAVPFVVVLGAAVRFVNGADAFDGGVAFINVPAMSLFGGVDVPRATLAAAVAGLVLAVVVRLSVPAALVVLAAGGLGLAWTAHATELEPFAEQANRTYVMGDDVGRLAIGGAVSYDIAAYDALASNRYQWQQPGLDLPYWAHEEPPVPVILSRKGPPPVEGARLVTAEPSRDLAVWVAPGAAQDALAEQDRLVLENGAPVPESFYEAEVERIDDTHVRITHRGGGAPWVPEGVLPGDVGLVRVLAGSSQARLPEVVHPGESVVLEVSPSTTQLELEHVHHRSFGVFDISV